MNEATGTSDFATMAFAGRLLSLLETGSFTTSYKYAVLLGLLDDVLEHTGPDGSPPRTIRARDVGRRVFDLYWRQARPFSDAGPLRQSGVNDLVTRIAELRSRLGIDEHTSLDVARRRHPDEITELEQDAIYVVVRFPIVLLQRFGTGASATEDRFIYDVAWSDSITRARVRSPEFDDRLRLAPGAGAHLIALAGLIRPVIEREWIRHVARRNEEHVDELRLERFLFGAERTSLQAIRTPLLDLQQGRCFYCGRTRGPWHVDHFLPWARWPDDRLDNLVVADARCNHDKRASLAALHHLERWWERSSPGNSGSARLADVARASGWPRRPERTAAGARGLYLHQSAGAMLWSGPGEVERLDVERLHTVLADVRLAAEDHGTYRDDT